MIDPTVLLLRIEARELGRHESAHKVAYELRACERRHTKYAKSTGAP